MALTNPLGYFLCMAVLAATTSVLVRTSSQWQKLLANCGRDRLSALDGLRGLLATGVFIYHAIYHFTFHRTGEWTFTPSSFYLSLGKDSVNIFFMITGYLFWTKSLRKKVSFYPLLVGRAYRLLPAYWGSLLLILLSVVVESRGILHLPLTEVLPAVGAWSTGGLLGQPAINAVDIRPINCGVTWSLQYEWCFYLVLPALAVFATFPGTVALLLGCAAAIAVSRSWQVSPPFLLSFVARFGMGMALAAVFHRYPMKWHWTRSRWVTLGTIGMLVLSWSLPKPEVALAIATWLLLAMVIQGNDILGLLRTRWLTALGHMSYSFYLLHGLVLYWGLRVWGQVIDLHAVTPWQYWILVALLSPIVLLISAWSYLALEVPHLKPAHIPISAEQAGGRR